MFFDTLLWGEVTSREKEYKVANCGNCEEPEATRQSPGYHGPHSRTRIDFEYEDDREKRRGAGWDLIADT